MLRFRGDTNPFTWELSIAKRDGTTEYLENAASVEFTYFKRGVEVKIVGTITDANAGLAKFSVLETDFDTVLKADFDIQVVFNDGTKRTFVKDKLEVEDDVNKS